MNLTRKLAVLASTSALCLAIAPGCGPKKPPGTTPPTSGGKSGGSAGGEGGSADGGERADGGQVTGGGDGGHSDAETCKADVADPALLFSNSILLRPPKGVEFPADDGNPTFAGAAMPGGFISACDGKIKRVSVVVLPGDKNVSKTLDEFVATLATQGYADGKDLGVKYEAAGEKHVAFEFPAQGGQPASSVYLAAVHRQGATNPPIEKIDNIFILFFETTPADFGILKDTFEATGKSVFVVPPG